jgi:hypothetical protein
MTTMPARRAATPRTATHHPHGMGRMPETAYNGPPIPSVPKYKVEAVEQWLFTHRNVRRPLNVAAPLLALVCALHEKEQRFPVRRRVAEWLRDNDFAEWNSNRPNSVDKAITVACALDEIEIRWDYEEGSIRDHRSMVRRRYLIPSRELWEAYLEASSGSVPLTRSSRAAGEYVHMAKRRA